MSPEQDRGALVRKELYVDDRFVDEMRGLARRFHHPVKCEENPVIRADRPWERGAAFVDSGLVIHDEQDGLFKAWYQGGACYGPDDGSLMCYATSRDGVHWDKPVLGVIEFEGNRQNNIVHRATCMMHDPAPIIDPAEPDPACRFKAIWWGGRKDASAEGGWRLGHCVGFSPDGIHWTEHPDNPVWPADGEVAVPSGLERTTGRHVMYCSADGYGMRVVARAESDDFMTWDLPPKLVFRSDKEDPPGTEMAGLCTVDYEGTHIGMLWVIQNLQVPPFTRQEWQDVVDRNLRQGYFGPPIQMNAVRCRIMHTELVTSQDGLSWERLRRGPLMPLGPEGSWDECISLAGRPFIARDRVWIYYTGQGRVTRSPGCTTSERIGQWDVDTGLATLRLDGFASLEPEVLDGEVLSKPFLLDGTDLQINADASAGSLRAEILDEQGRPLEGFGGQAFQIITGDQLRARMRWVDHSNVSALRGRMIRVRLRLHEASLYSISVRDGQDAASRDQA